MLNNVKQPETTCNKQETPWNNLQQETTWNEQGTIWNNPQQVKHNLQWPKRTYNEQELF